MLIWYNKSMKKTEMNETSNTEMVTISRAEYENYQAQEAHISAQDERIVKLEQQVSVLTEALRLSRHKQFGASSEKSREEIMDQLSFLFNEAEVFAAPEEENVVVVPEHKRRKKHEYTLDSIPEDVPTEVVEHTLEGEALVCPQCGDTMTEIGVEVVKKLKIEPIRFVVEEHRYHTYACQTCNKEDIETPVVKAPREKSIIPGSCHSGGYFSYHGAEVRHGFSHLPAGAGNEKNGDLSVPADHVQLDPQGLRGIPDAGL